jgi:hypothetical protein
MVTAFQYALRLNPTKMHQSLTLPLVASSMNEMMMQYLLHFPKKEIISNLISHDPVYEISIAIDEIDVPQT